MLIAIYARPGFVVGLRRLSIACLVSWLGMVWAGNAQADYFSIKNARIDLVDGVYRLDADFEFQLPPPVLSALNNGVVLTLVVDIEVLQPRAYIWNKGIAALEQRYEIQYHALTDQYLLHNKNSGAHLIFSSLDSALFSLGHVRQLPLIDASLLEADADYLVRVRSRLDFRSLPVPLQLKAYLSSEWRVSSEWYPWELRAD